ERRKKRAKKKASPKPSYGNVEQSSSGSVSGMEASGKTEVTEKTDKVEVSAAPPPAKQQKISPKTPFQNSTSRNVPTTTSPAHSKSKRKFKPDTSVSKSRAGDTGQQKKQSPGKTVPPTTPRIGIMDPNLKICIDLEEQKSQDSEDELTILLKDDGP